MICERTQKEDDEKSMILSNWTMIVSNPITVEIKPPIIIPKSKNSENQKHIRIVNLFEFRFSWYIWDLDAGVGVSCQM